MVPGTSTLQHTYIHTTYICVRVVKIPQKKTKTARTQMFPLLRWTPYFISAKKSFIKNRLGEILDNLLRINMMSVAFF